MGFESARRALNDQREITQKKMAELCGVSESTISRYLSGQSVPPADIAEKLAALLPDEPAAPGSGADPPVQTDRELLRLYMWIIEHQQKEKHRLFLCLEILVAFVLVFLLIDVFNGNVGWLRH